MKVPRNAVLGILFVIALTFSLGFLAIRSTKADKPTAAQQEVTLTPQQQKPVKELMVEKKAFDDRKDGEISGALRMLMSQIIDPSTGEVGLDPARWMPKATDDGQNGFKFVRVAAPSDPEKKP